MNSLYAHTGKRYTCDGDVCRMVEPDAEGATVLIASERLSEDPGWDKVPANHIVVVDENHNVQFEAAYTQQFNALVNCTERSDGVRAEGFELDIQARVTDNIDLGINYTSIDATWQVDSPDCLTAAGLADTFEPPGQMRGDTLIGVPDYSGSAYFHYSFDSAPFGADAGFLRFDLMYQGEVKVNDDNLDDNLPNPSYVLANANAYLDYGRFSVVGFSHRPFFVNKF